MPTKQDPTKDSTAQAKEELGRARDEAQQFASEAADTARERGREQLEQAKDEAAHRAEDLADAIDETADRLGDDGDAVSGYGHSMATMMRRFAGGLREHEIEEFAEQLAGFARRNPATFLAGSVALGFGLSRFLKASSHRAHEEYGFGSAYEGGEEHDEDAAYLDEDLYYEEEALGTSMGAGSSSAGDGDTNRERAVPGTQPESEYPPGATGRPAGSDRAVSDKDEQHNQPGGKRP